MAKKTALILRSKNGGRMTITDLKRSRGYGEYRQLIESFNAEMKEDKLIPAEMYDRIVDRFGPYFMSRSHFYRICDDLETNPKTAVRDLRSVNSGRKGLKLSDPQKYALKLVLAHDLLNNSGLCEARDEVINFAEEFALKASDVPPLWRCYYRRKNLTVIERRALEDNYKDVWKFVGGFTEHPQYAPDQQHNFDEGKHSVAFQVQKGKNNRVRISFSLQVDRGTFVFRMPYFSFGKFTERDSVLAYKIALSPAPEVGLPYCCLPKQSRCDNASIHGTSFHFVDEWLRNRSGRTGRIVYNPVAQPQANPSAERGVGEVKRKFLREFLSFLAEDKDFNRPTVPGAVAHLNDIKRLLIEFINKHNNRLMKGTGIPRIQKYLADSPAESKSVKVEEINKNVLYVQQMPLGPSGVKIDGYRYDGAVPSRYLQRDDTYIGVAPEGNSTFAVLFVMDPETKEVIRVSELDRTDLVEVSPSKQKQFIDEFTVATEENTPVAAILDKGIRRGRAKEREATQKAEAERAAALETERQKSVTIPDASPAPVDTTPAQSALAPIELPPRPQIDTLKAA